MQPASKPSGQATRPAVVVLAASIVAACATGPGTMAPPAQPTPGTTRFAGPTAAPTSVPAATMQADLLEMRAPRADPEAVLLADGRVVVIGGYKLDGIVPTGEVYDPSTGSFDAFDSPEALQYFHTATLLADGRILVVGGFGRDLPAGRSTVDTIRTFDPRSLQFADAGMLPVPRALHTATLLDDGRVLIVGGYSKTADGPIATAITWDPVTGTTAPAGELAHRRAWHSATKLPDGRVLVTGGPAEAEVWDPATETFASAGSLAAPRWWASAVLVDGGRVLVTGGFAGEGFGDGAPSPVNAAEVWDPGTNTWTAAGRLIEARGLHTSTVLDDGRVVLIGGIGVVGSGASRPTTSVEVWIPATNTFVAGPSLHLARSNLASVLLPDGRILVIGGADVTDHGIPTAEWVVPPAP